MKSIRKNATEILATIGVDWLVKTQTKFGKNIDSKAKNFKLMDSGIHAVLPIFIRDFGIPKLPATILKWVETQEADIINIIINASSVMAIQKFYEKRVNSDFMNVIYWTGLPFVSEKVASMVEKQF